MPNQEEGVGKGKGCVGLTGGIERRLTARYTEIRYSGCIVEACVLQNVHTGSNAGLGIPAVHKWGAGNRLLWIDTRNGELGC
jgi:hypothetical protein